LGPENFSTASFETLIVTLIFGGVGKTALETRELTIRTINARPVGVSFGNRAGVFKAEEQYIRFLKKGAAEFNRRSRCSLWWLRYSNSRSILVRGVGTTNSNQFAPTAPCRSAKALRYIRGRFRDVVVAGGAEAPLTTITTAVRHHYTMSRCDDPIGMSASTTARRICHGEGAHR